MTFAAFSCPWRSSKSAQGPFNAAIAALRFFFNVTLERPDLVRPLTTANNPRKAPVVLSEEEVARLLEAAPGLKYKAALSVAHGAGLRVRGREPHGSTRHSGERYREFQHGSNASMLKKPPIMAPARDHCRKRRSFVTAERE
jgi:hypothetical protein